MLTFLLSLSYYGSKQRHIPVLIGTYGAPCKLMSLFMLGVRTLLNDVDVPYRLVEDTRTARVKTYGNKTIQNKSPVIAYYNGRVLMDATEILLYNVENYKKASLRARMNLELPCSFNARAYGELQ
ncbi:hypothetical protein Y032_0100g3260 [Ancylostoma ceylanicum]|uniref:GST N-terminal domain-containing protein n=1 Tax=Ancylostoma ceylanicum TaxID=53326 RepID=A0A016TI91_9BILA|nr:hypothetical protein Y032_0100g3260 [Ancylostoma ceylanicum]